MIIYGASGNTKEEIESVLNLKGIDNATKAMKDMKEIMSNGTKIAERIWIEDSFTILDSFKEKFGQIESGGFKDSPEKTRSIINQWVEKQTNNQIKDLFPEGTINETNFLQSLLRTLLVPSPFQKSQIFVYANSNFVT